MKKKISINESQLRIIGGSLRGRKLSFVESEGLRPTGDRIRETLFNWLMPDIVDSKCLDLFAGSGALGFESLSRSAARVTMIEKNRLVFERLQCNLSLLGDFDKEIEIVCADSLAWLKAEEKDKACYDIVYLDPPFNEDCLSECCQVLESEQWLVPSALIYIEQAKKTALCELPTNWHLLKEKTAGTVRYCLYQRKG